MATEELAGCLGIETCAVRPLLQIAHAKLAALEATDRASASIHEDFDVSHAIAQSSERKATNRERTMRHLISTIQRPPTHQGKSTATHHLASDARAWLLQRLGWERRLRALRANHERAAGPTNSPTSDEQP